jgi:WD40 repeat protein
MKSLLKCSGQSVVVGLDSQALLITEDNAYELNPDPTMDHNEATESKSTSSDAEEDDGNDDTPQQRSRSIECVAISHCPHDGSLWCATSRADKSLDLYRECKWQRSYTTPKRTSCITFAWNPVGMILCGDLVGDATAFPIEGENRSGRLLLGHTASMLTDIQLVRQDTLLTADRDEKVRVSSFPQTCIIKGYLLGHSAFVSCIDVITQSDIVVTCSGDHTLRLWTLSTYTEIAREDMGEKLPIQVSATSELVTVIFHNTNAIHVYSVPELKLVQTLNSDSQPIALTFQERNMVVLSKEPTLLKMYSLNNHKRFEEVSLHTAIETFLNSKTFNLPTSILEVDSNGQLKMGKRQETRTSNPADIPWNRVERIQKARDSRNRRNRKRKAGL